MSGTYGAGLPYGSTSRSAVFSNIQINIGYWAPYQLSLSLTKISICLFYLRVFQDKTSRRISIASIVFIALYTIPLIFAGSIRCIPVRKMYDPWVPGHCNNQTAFYIASAALNAVMDAWLIVVVVPRILPLKLPRRQKIALLVVVSLGWV